MVEGVGRGGSLARAAIEAALARHAEAARRVSEHGAAKPEAASAAAGFSERIAEGIRAVDAQVQRAEQLPFDLVAGRVTDLHEVAAQLKQSDLAFKFALEVRNKFVDAYREVMRMNV
jgi:flagellar hook-basal body complex protein FliE